MNKKGITPGILNIIIVSAIILTLLIASFVSTELRFVIIGVGIIVLGLSVMGKLKEDRSKVIAFMITLIVGLGLILISTTGVIQQVFEGDEIIEEDGKQILTFCDERQECIDYLVEEKGMPEDYLEESDYDIKCTDGVCEVITE